MSGLSHVVFLILTIIFPPFALLWIICAVSAGNSKKRQDRKLMERQTVALEELARANKVNQWKGWMDK